MPRYRGVEVWSDVQAAGGSRLAAVPDVVSLAERRRLDGTDELVLGLPISSPAWSSVGEQRALRVTYQDASYDEWRIAAPSEAREKAGPLAAVKCLPILSDLARAIVGRTEGDGSVAHDVEALRLTPTQHIDSFILPALADAGLTWIARGTIDATAAVDMSYQWLSPLAALRELAELTGTELRLRRNGTTQYLIDLVTEIGAGTPTPLVIVGRNLTEVKRERSGTEQATRVYPRGGADDGMYATMARARWRVSAVSGTTITLADPDGAAAPVRFDDQLNGLYLRKTDGTLTQITDSIAATSQVVVASATGIATSQQLEIRRNAAGADLTYLDHPTAKVAPPTGYGLRAAVLDRGDVPSSVNVVANPTLASWSAGLPVSWTALGAPTITETTAPERWQTGGRSARVQTTGDGQGLETASIVIGPSASRPYFSGFARLYVISGRVRLELVASDGVTTYVLPDGTDGRAWTNVRDVWVDLGVAGIDLNALAATSARLRIVQDGPGTAEWYLDGAQLVQRAAHVPFIEGSGPNRLWHAANDHLETFAAPLVQVSARLIDLERLDATKFADDAFVMGGTVRLRDSALGIDVTTRVVEIGRNLLVAGDVELAFSNRPEDLTDALLRPRRSPRTGSGAGADTILSVQAYFAAPPATPGVLTARLAARPAGASIYYAVQTSGATVPVIGGSGWNAYTAPFSVTQSATDDQQVVAYVQLGARFSEVKQWRIPAFSSPNLSLSLTENPAGTLNISWTPIGDVAYVAVYRKKNGAGNGWPTTNNNIDGVLDQAQFLGQFHVAADGGGWDPAGTRVGGRTSYAETGYVNGDVVKVILVPLDKNLTPIARVTASRTIAGISPVLTSFTSALTANGTSCAAPAQATVSWTVSAGVSDATHDLLVYRSRSGEPRELRATITTPVTTASVVDNLDDYVSTGPTYQYVYSYELVTPSIVDSGAASSLGVRVTGTCPI